MNTREARFAQSIASAQRTLNKVRGILKRARKVDTIAHYTAEVERFEAIIRELGQGLTRTSALCDGPCNRLAPCNACLAHIASWHGEPVDMAPSLTRYDLKVVDGAVTFETLGDTWVVTSGVNGYTLDNGTLWQRPELRIVSQREDGTTMSVTMANDNDWRVYVTDAYGDGEGFRANPFAEFKSRNLHSLLMNAVDMADTIADNAREAASVIVDDYRDGWEDDPCGSDDPFCDCLYCLPGA